MGGLAPDPFPGPPGSVPPTGPPPTAAPWYPPLYPPLPPKRTNVALIIVIVVVVVVLVTVILAAVLYIMVSGLIQAPNPLPIISLGPVDQTGGNATIPVASSSREIDPSGVQLRLVVNSTVTTTGMPPPGVSVVLLAAGYTLRVFWLDEDNDRVFGTGDALRVTGDSVPLPGSTAFGLGLSITTAAGTTSSAVTWTTP